MALIEAARVIETLGQMKLPEAAKNVRDHIEETLTYYRFPKTHWRQSSTDNLLRR